MSQLKVLNLKSESFSNILKDDDEDDEKSTPMSPENTTKAPNSNYSKLFARGNNRQCLSSRGVLFGERWRLLLKNRGRYRSIVAFCRPIPRIFTTSEGYSSTTLNIY
ncbi:unnamed protein product [Timema podura]|uniref:Uncharacterized protein n=1 Tax=Timema podura TaxID=61482 RepID=A0ABN7NW16_TIMPD|nr:unnamed protein product [Timema podura]